MGNGAIPIPDVSQLPIKSPESEYNLQNAAVTLSPQPSLAPGAMGPTLSPDESTAELEQARFQSYINPPDFSQLQNPQQFQQADPLEQVKQEIAQRMQARQVEQGPRRSRIKAMLTNFLQGGGEAMMVQAGLETPAQQHQRDINTLLQINNAQAMNDFRNAQIQDYQLKQQRVQRTMPDGSLIEIPFTHAATFDAAMAKVQAAQRAREEDPFATVKQMYGQSMLMDLQQGLPGPSERTQQVKRRYDEMMAAGKPVADISPDRETFNYYTRPRAEGGQGLTPAQAYAQMHPRQQLTVGSTDVKDIADAIENGDQPPTLTGLYRNAAPVRAELARRGVPIARMEMDWNATKKYMATLNGPQQVRLRQAIETASDSLDKIQSLYAEWSKLAPVSGFKVANHAALVAMKNLPGRAGAVANSLDAQIADLTAELGNVYMGGNSPTDHALKLAQQNLSSDWGPAAFEEAMKQARLNIGIRKNSITHGAPAGVSGENTYMPPAAVSPQTVPSGPPAGASMKVPGSDGKMHWSDGQKDLGVAE